MSSSSPDHQHHQSLINCSDQYYYVHCNFCDLLLAVSVPSDRLSKPVTVRCGQCTNLLSVNMRAVLDLHSPQPSSHLEKGLISRGRGLSELNTMN